MSAYECNPEKVCQPLGEHVFELLFDMPPGRAAG